MLKHWQFWILTVLALTQAALVGINIFAFNANRKLQAEVSQRAQTVQQAVQFEQLTRDMAVALAQLATRNQDPQIRAMLTSLGITVNVNEEAPRNAAAAAAATGDGKRK